MDFASKVMSVLPNWSLSVITKCGWIGAFIVIL